MDYSDLYSIYTTDIKELKIEIQRNINTYLNYSLPLCAILADKRKYSWLFEHFIELYTLSNENNSFWVDFLEDRDFYKDVADYEIIDANIMKNEKSIIDFIKEKINGGYYLIIQLDEFYLPNKRAFGQNHKIHQIMIHGFNDIGKTVKTISFNNKLDFTTQEYKYSVISDAYNNGKLFYNDKYPWEKKENVEIIKPIDSYNITQRNLNAILNGIKKYISGEGDYNKIRPFNIEVFGKKACFNTKVLRDIQSHLKCGEKNNACVDYRYIHLLFEHKLLMLHRLNYIAKHCNTNSELEELIQHYSKIVKATEKLKFVFLKQTLVESNFQTISNPIRNKSTIDKAIELLTFIEEHEKPILIDFCNSVGLDT